MNVKTMHVDVLVDFDQLADTLLWFGQPCHSIPVWMTRTYPGRLGRDLDC